MVNRYDADGCQSAIGNYVSYEDYENLAKSVRACVAAIREGSLTIEHVQGYLEGVVGVLDDN